MLTGIRRGLATLLETGMRFASLSVAYEWSDL